MNDPFCHSLNMNGPVPIGALLLGLVLKSVPSYKCLGTIGSEPTSKMPRNGPNGCFSVNTTVRSSGASTFSSCTRLARARAWVCLHISIENRTSADVNGLPSCQVTPGLSLKVYTLASSLTVQLSARPGSGSSFGLWRSRPSKILPDTIWVGPFWIMASIRPGGSGWITALMTPPIFCSCASATLAPQVKTRPSTIFFSMTYLLRAGCYGWKALLKPENASFGPVETTTREAHMTLIQAAR